MDSELSTKYQLTTKDALPTKDELLKMFENIEKKTIKNKIEKEQIKFNHNVDSLYYFILSQINQLMELASDPSHVWRKSSYYSARHLTIDKNKCYDAKIYDIVLQKFIDKGYTITYGVDLRIPNIKISWS
jgi:hypothetical protein